MLDTQNWIKSKRMVISKYASQQISNSDQCSFQQEYVSPRILSFTGKRITEIAVKKKYNGWAIKNYTNLFSQ